MTNDIIVELKDVVKYFPVQKGLIYNLLLREKKFIHAVDGVSLFIKRGETLSLVGETGSGKTTLGKITLGLIKPTSGAVYFEGNSIFDLDKNTMKKLRRDMQMVFQDPFASINPRDTIEDIIGAPFEIHNLAKKGEKREMVTKLMEEVGLTPAYELLDKYPHELSGGQRQRVVIARAIALKPKFIVADEPVSSLDVSIRTQILKLMKNLKEKLRLTYLWISHDLATVQHIADRIAVLYLGKLVESAETEELVNSPLHPYTKALISAVPIPDPNLKKQLHSLEGEIPSPINPPPGCRFHPRCPYAMEKCKVNEPELIALSKTHFVRCFLME